MFLPDSNVDFGPINYCYHAEDSRGIPVSERKLAGRRPGCLYTFVGRVLSTLLIVTQSSVKDRAVHLGQKVGHVPELPVEPSRPSQS